MSPKDLESWLRDTLRNQINTAEKSIQKVKGDVEAQIASLSEITSDLLAKSNRDCTEKRTDKAAYKSARAVNRMCEELHDLSSSYSMAEPQSHEGLKQFSDGVAKLGADAARTREKWIGQIRPYYILDMMSLNASIEKLRRLGDQAWDVFSKESTLLRGIEETRDRERKMQDLEQSVHRQREEHGRILAELDRVGPQINETQDMIESLENDPRLADLRKVESRMGELRVELLALGFRRLGRPLRKLQSISVRGEYPISSEVREKLEEYLKKPFMTFVHETEGYPLLRSVLRNLQDAVQHRKLVLKQREERKVLERIRNVNEQNVLSRIHNEAKKLLAERERHLQDPNDVELNKGYRQKRQQLKDLKLKREYLVHQLDLQAERIEASRNALSQFVKETELLIRKLTKRAIKISWDNR